MIFRFNEPALRRERGVAGTLRIADETVRDEMAFCFAYRRCREHADKVDTSAPEYGFLGEFPTFRKWSAHDG